MRISIVVICLNEEKNLPRCLGAIRDGNKSQMDLELIVVDGDSTDRSCELARSFGATILHSSRGVSRQRNAGARAASGDILAFVDADIEVTPGWFDAVRKNFTGQSELMLGSTPMVPANASWITRAFSLHLGVGLEPRSTSERCERYLATGSLVMHRHIFEKLGGFREDMAVDEDTDFILRAKQLRVAQRCDPALAYIHHGEPGTWLQFFSRTIWGANYSAWFKAIRSRDKQMMWRPQYLYGLVTAINVCSLLAGMVALSLGFGWRGLAVAFTVTLMCILAPGILTSCRRRVFHLIPQMCAFYAGLGLGHAVAMVGIGRNKFRRWR